MIPVFVAIAPDLRADHAITALRRVKEVAETLYYAYGIDPEERLLGVLSLRNFVLARPETPVRELMVVDPIRVRADADQATAARLLTDHRLLAIPVVDGEDHLLGIVTQDDVAEILEAEATEDIERLGGSQPLEPPDLRASILLPVRLRVLWLPLLRRLGIDPAVVSAPLITTLVDGTGLVIYFTIAKRLLGL